MWPNPQETADWVTFTEETLIGKLHFLSSGKLQGRWESNVHLMNSIDQSIPESCSYQTVIDIHEEDVRQKKDLKILQPSKAYMRNLQELLFHLRHNFQINFSRHKTRKSEIYLKTLLNICDGAFYENSKQLLAVNYFCKKFYHGCFTSS